MAVAGGRTEDARKYGGVREGLAGASRLAGLAMEAYGCEVVLYETVGVGQGEVEVASAAETVVLCLQPGAGDAVQALKAGVMEIADVFCVNKADHPRAKRAAAEVRSMLEIGHELDPDTPLPPIVMTRGDKGEGIDDLKTRIEEHRAQLLKSGQMEERRKASLRELVVSWATSRLEKEIEARLGGQDAELMQEVYDRKLDPISASERLLRESAPPRHPQQRPSPMAAIHGLGGEARVRCVGRHLGARRCFSASWYEREGTHAARRESFRDVTGGELTLVAFRVTATGLRSRAAVTLSCEDGCCVDAAAEGDGSTDAIFRAVDAAVGVRGKLTGLRIYAFSDFGLVGKARVRVAFEGREYAGRGSSADPVEAAAHAYLRATAAYLMERSPRAGAE